MLLHACAAETLGEQENERNALTFEAGLYGLEDIKRYELLGSGQPGSPFMWLHALGQELYFAVIDPWLVMPDYSFDLSAENMLRLGATNPDQFVVLSIVAIPERVEDMTANLKSPVIINTKTRRGMQLILDDEKYSVRHRIITGERRSAIHAGDH